MDLQYGEVRHMVYGNPRLGVCLCSEEATIRNTKAEDGRLHFQCHDLTPEGKAKHYGFVDRSAAEDINDDDEVQCPYPGCKELESQCCLVELLHGRRSPTASNASLGHRPR